MDISNFNKTKDLRGNQALDINSSNNKEQKTTSIQLFYRRWVREWHKVGKIFLDKATLFFQYTGRFFRKVWFL